MTNLTAFDALQIKYNIPREFAWRCIQEIAEGPTEGSITPGLYRRFSLMRWTGMSPTEATNFLGMYYGEVAA